MSQERMRWLAAAACLMAAAGSLAAQDERFFETVDVNVVSIEVIVTDQDGNPVTGLGRDDFEVYEDGKRMELSNFYAVAGREPLAPAGAGEAVAPPAPAVPGPETKRLNLVVFIDNLNILPQNRNLLFESLRVYLRERLDPRDQVMVVSFDGGAEVVQPFTNDAQALVAALERIESDVGRHIVIDSERRMWSQQVQSASTRNFNPPTTTGRGGGSQLPGAEGDLSFTADRDPDFDMAVDAAVEHSRSLRSIAERRVRKVRGTVRAIRTFCATLAGIPGRKALVYVSDGLPLRPADSLAQEFSDRFERWMMRNEQHIPSSKNRELEQALMLLSSGEFDVAREFRGLVEAASSERVAFYPISHQGPRGGHVSADVRGSASAAAVRMEQMTLQSSLLDMAEGTGGIAFIETPNLEALLERVVEDFTSFYSLGYTSPRSESGAFHKIEVKVRGQGLRVRHLRGYRDKSGGAELDDLALGAVHHGVGSNPMEVSLEAGELVPAGKRDRYRVPVVIKIPFNKLVLVPDGDFHSGKLSLSVAVRDVASGGASPPQQIELPIRVPNDKILEAMGQVVAYSVELELKKGSKRISVGVHDHVGQSDSTVSLELSVGDDVND